MKRINRNLLLLLLSLTAAFSNCKEDLIAPLENNTNPPGKVSNISITNGPGNATITFSLPGDKDLLYIKAVYNLQMVRRWK
jgi:hypothetical protein